MRSSSYSFFKLLNDFFYIGSCPTIITTQFYSISIPNPVHPSTPHPGSVGNCKFFRVCESVSVLQRSSLCHFFRFHRLVRASDVGVSLSD